MKFEKEEEEESSAVKCICNKKTTGSENPAAAKRGISFSSVATNEAFEKPQQKSVVNKGCSAFALSSAAGKTTTLAVSL